MQLEEITMEIYIRDTIPVAKSMGFFSKVKKE